MSIVNQLEADHPANFTCAQAGCRECLEQLMVQHGRLVYAVVKRQYGGQVEYNELLQAGRIGLWQAILHFEPERGNRFSTYAWVAIRNQVWREVGEVWRRAGWQEVCPAPDELSTFLSRWETRELAPALREGLHRLPERRRQVIVLAYGLEGTKPHSLAEIGRLWGISRERVRQLRNDALVLLRLPLLSLPIRQLYEQNDRPAYRRAERMNRVWQRGKRK
jgi:RNA polymerase sporulation-specific sigma factor